MPIEHQALPKNPAVPEVVLIAEDEAFVRILANDILTEAGYDVIEARDGREALTILESRNSVRVLFTDIRMPRLDGLSLARIVGERWPQIGVVVTSADYAADGDGAIFVAKPYDIDGIVRAIKLAVDASSFDVPQRKKLKEESS